MNTVEQSITSNAVAGNADHDTTRGGVAAAIDMRLDGKRVSATTLHELDTAWRRPWTYGIVNLRAGNGSNTNAPGQTEFTIVFVQRETLSPLTYL